MQLLSLILSQRESIRIVPWDLHLFCISLTGFFSRRENRVHDAEAALATYQRSDHEGYRKA
jgi:hypothetical protein